VRFVDQNNGASVALTGTGLAYIWNQAGFGSCTNGTWAYTTWAPSTGCGSPITQTRTGTCTAAGAGTQTQAVTCQGIGGTVVADALCVGAGTKPDTNQNCTASPGISCPKEDALTQSATLTNGVGCGTPGGGSTGPGPGAPGGDPSQPAQPGFSWSGGCATFATTCTGGSGLWTVNPSWTPATGTCTETSVQTRAFSCVGKAGSGTQACTAAQCLDSDGNPAPSASCGSLPTGPSCTPTTATCTGTQPANQQQSGPPDHSACPTPSWVSGAFGICTGGSGSFSAWTPLTGCGPATQARTCIPVAGSGTQTQTPTCQWNDGASAPGACIGTGPTTQVCTPGPSSCGAGLLVQALPDCPVTPGSCVSDPAQSHFCVHVPLN
jgi:hypothetical protein